MKIHIKNGRLVDPKHGIDERLDVFIAAGRVVGVGKAPADFHANRVIDAEGLVVCPGLVDLSARLRAGDGAESPRPSTRSPAARPRSSAS